MSIDHNSIAGDGVVNISERAQEITIEGTAEPGAQVVVSVASVRVTGVIADPLGAWSVAVPANATYIVETARGLLVTARASKVGFEDAADTVTIRVDLTAPNATYVAPASLAVDKQVSVTARTSDTDIDSFALKSGSSLPLGLRLDAATGAVRGAPTAFRNALTSQIVITDTAGNTSEVSIQFPQVMKGFQDLSGFSYQPNRVTVSQQPTLTQPASMIGTPSYSSSNTSVCTVDGTTGVLTIRGVGTCQVRVTVPASANYLESTTTLTVQVYSGTGVPPSPPSPGSCAGDGAPPCEIPEEEEEEDCDPLTDECGDGEEDEGEDCDPLTDECDDGEEDEGEDCDPLTEECDDSEEDEEEDCDPLTDECDDGEEDEGEDCDPLTDECDDGEEDEGEDCDPLTEECDDGEEDEGDEEEEATKTCWNESEIPVDQVCPIETKICWDGSVIPIGQPCPLNKCERDPQPDDYTTMPHPPIATVEYQWVTIVDIFTFECTQHQEQRTRTTTTTYHVTFGCSGGCWVSSVTPSSTSTTSAWSRSGVTQSCSGSRSASASAMTLSAGRYEMQWGEERIVFTVPTGATVELSRRQLASGNYVAVLSLNKGEELVIGADALSGDDQARSTRFADTANSTLRSIALSLADPATLEAEPTVTTGSECAVAEASEDGTTTVDLDADSCVIVREGGSITVSRIGESHTLSLATGREWLIVDNPVTTAATFIDISTGGYITLSLSDGSELSRHIPDGANDLPALFDAMRTVPPPAPSEEDGG